MTPQLPPPTGGPWWASYVLWLINGVVAPAVLMWWNRRMRNESHKEHLQTAVKASQIETKVDEVHAEVKTANALKLGEMADATETRRVEEIPEKDRTEAEQAHFDLVPPKH